MCQGWQILCLCQAWKQWNYIGEDSYTVVGGHLYPRNESKYLCGGCWKTGWLFQGKGKVIYRPVAIWLHNLNILIMICKWWWSWIIPERFFEPFLQAMDCYSFSWKLVMNKQLLSSFHVVLQCARFLSFVFIFQRMFTCLVVIIYRQI